MDKYNIERNKLDFILTDTMPVEISELFSYNNFYEFLSNNIKQIKTMIFELKKNKANGNMLFEGNWATEALKYNILKGNDSKREIGLLQPLSILNLYFFMECYQKEILNLFDDKSFSIRYHKKNNELYYKQKDKKIVKYFQKINLKIEKEIIQQTGTYFKIGKFNSLVSFFNSSVWQKCNLEYKYFCKIDYKSCFDSIYTHSYKWIIEKNVVDSKKAKNSNLYVEIDRILQNINGKSSNGLIVGPEFSRMIAEILLQHIDKDVESKLYTNNKIKNQDYSIYRYVDDIFIFAKEQETINLIVNLISDISQKYLLKLNEFKLIKSNTPVILNQWLKDTRALADKIADIFNTAKELKASDNNTIIKDKYINSNRIKEEFNILMVNYTKDTRYIVSYLLSTFLNNIYLLKDGYKLYNKSSKIYVLLDLILYIYSYCPCFEHTQKIISILVYFDNEIDFNSNKEEHDKLVKFFRKYSIIFENSNLYDICNIFIFFYEFNITLLPKSETIIFNNIKKENNPILLAHYLIYSQYNENYNKTIKEEIENIIKANISKIIDSEIMLQKEFWYVLIFYNCPYLSEEITNLLNSKIDKIKPTQDKSFCDRTILLLHKYLSIKQLNGFFYWGYYKFNTSRQLTYRTYQRTMFKQYKDRKNIEIYGSLET